VNNAKGLWSAFGALIGGAAGAAAGYAAAQYRPRLTYRRRVHARGAQEIEDAMVVGGAAGAVIGAFVGGAVGGDGTAPTQLR
jgi:hypothetical protein